MRWATPRQSFSESNWYADNLTFIAGVSGNYPMIGFDLTKDESRSRLYAIDQAQALMKGNHDVVIQNTK